MENINLEKFISRYKYNIVLLYMTSYNKTIISSNTPVFPDVPLNLPSAPTYDVNKRLNRLNKERISLLSKMDNNQKLINKLKAESYKYADRIKEINSFLSRTKGGKSRKTRKSRKSRIN